MPTPIRRPRNTIANAPVIFRIANFDVRGPNASIVVPKGLLTKIGAVDGKVAVAVVGGVLQIVKNVETPRGCPPAVVVTDISKSFAAQVED